ncbi:hypothetical protein [Mesorhizobium loti]|uniref:hypothetical protein n=1 Tax=Rhizobium loti TaxID=381 RepID=UPI0011B58BB5|nr:hypothetical protein [Mesorhizobium loti]
MPALKKLFLVVFTTTVAACLAASLCLADAPSVNLHVTSGHSNAIPTNLPAPLTTPLPSLTWHGVAVQKLSTTTSEGRHVPQVPSGPTNPSQAQAEQLSPSIGA